MSTNDSLYQYLAKLKTVTTRFSNKRGYKDDKYRI